MISQARSATVDHERGVRHSSDRRNLALITAVWIVAAVIVNPIGDFPLNDDWAYGWSVRSLLETGEFQLSDWTAVNLLPQVLWGALFSVPFGFSFTILRFTTLAVGLIGVYTTYWLLREIGTRPHLSLLGALTLALNPVYFALSYTFMSDIPSFTLTTASLYFFVRGLRRDSEASFVAGVVLCLVTILNRQTGVLLLPAFAVAYLLQKGRDARILPAAGALVLGGVVYFGYPLWLERTGRAPHLYGHQTRLLLESAFGPISRTVAVVGENVFHMMPYVGLFLLPFVVPVLLSGDGERRETRVLWRREALFLGVLLVAGLVAARYAPLPTAGNVMGRLGVGPSALSPSSHPKVVALWQAVTVVAVLGAGMLVRAIARCAREGSWREDPAVRGVAVVLGTSIVLFLLPVALLPLGLWFDRYLLAVLPPLMCLAAWGTVSSSPVAREATILAIGGVLLAGSALYTITATHDYLTWNRIRWQAVHQFQREKGVEPGSMHSGFEINGWYLAQKIEQCNPDYKALPAEPSWEDFSCLNRRETAAYAATTYEMEGYSIERRYPVRRWLPPRSQDLLILRKEP